MKNTLAHAALILAALAFASCSRDDHHDHDHDHNHNGHDHGTHDHKSETPSPKQTGTHAAHDGHDHAKHDHAAHDHRAHNHKSETPAPKPAVTAHEKHDDHEGHDHAKDDHAGHNHFQSGHDHAESATASVTFTEGRGLKFQPGTASALGLTTTRVATRPLAHRITLNATVIDSGPPVKVTALVPPSIADDMESHPHEGVRLIAVNRALVHATAQVEVTLALGGPTPNSEPGSRSPSANAIGDTLALPLTGPAEILITIPNTAILRTVAGTFAYRYRDGYYQRTPIALGVTDGAHTQLLAGLAENDEVATAAIEQLWLTELRLTKGGGHSH